MRVLAQMAAVVAAAAAVAPSARPQNPDQLYDQAAAARQAQQFDQAILLLTTLLAADPDHVDALVQLGFAQLGDLDPKAAQASFEQALRLAPDYADAVFGAALSAFRLGRLTAARDLVAPLIVQHPADHEYAKLLDAIETAKSAKPPLAPQHDPGANQSQDRLTLLLAKGQELRRQGRHDEAADRFQEAMALAPARVEPLLALAQIEGQQSRFGEARRLFERALAVDRDSIDAQLGLARLDLWQNRPVAARGRIEAVLLAAPDQIEARLLEAQGALILDERDRALRLYRGIVDDEPKNPEALIGLGDALLALGDRQGARAAFVRAATLAPQSIDPEKRLAAPRQKRWRLDLGSEISDLGGRSNWTDSAAVLGYRWSNGSAIAIGSRLATRNRKKDLQLHLRLDQVFSSSLSGYVQAGAVPKSDFLAQRTLGGGASIKVLDPTKAFGPLLIHADLRHDHHEDDDIWSLSLGPEFHLVDQRFSLSPRWIHARDEDGTKANGYLIRLDASVNEALRYFAGYADAPEISAGQLDDTSTIFGGLAYQLNEDVAINVNLAHEDRTAFDRLTFGAGLSVRF